VAVEPVGNVSENEVGTETMAYCGLVIVMPLLLAALTDSPISRSLEFELLLVDFPQAIKLIVIPKIPTRTLFL
jgi:hypothetical protein